MELIKQLQVLHQMVRKLLAPFPGKDTHYYTHGCLCSPLFNYLGLHRLLSVLLERLDFLAPRLLLATVIHFSAIFHAK